MGFTAQQVHDAAEGSESVTPIPESHMQTLMTYELGYNQNYDTLISILLIKIVLCSKFS